MRRQFLRRGLLLAGIHAFVCLGLVLLLADSMGGFGPGAQRESDLAFNVAAYSLLIIGAPLLWLWLVREANPPAALGAVLFLANSALWGVAGAFFWELISGVRSVIRKARSDDPPPAPGTVAAALRVPVAWVVFTWQVAWKRLRIWIPRLLAALVALAILGYASNLVSKGVCRKRTQVWLEREVTEGFRLSTVEKLTLEKLTLPLPEVGPVRWRCPFVVDVHYSFPTSSSPYSWSGGGWRRYICLFGITVYVGEERMWST